MKKTCTKCEKEKVLEDFKKDKRAPNGRTSICKVCTNVAQKKYKEVRYKANKKYMQTEKGKAAVKRAQEKYAQTEKGIAAYERHQINRIIRQSEKDLIRRKEL